MMIIVKDDDQRCAPTRTFVSNGRAPQLPDLGGEAENYVL